MEEIRYTLDGPDDVAWEKFLELFRAEGINVKWWYRFKKKQAKRAAREIRRQNRRELREKKRLSRKTNKTKHST